MTEPWKMPWEIEPIKQHPGLTAAEEFEYELLWLLGRPVCCNGWPFRGFI